ncbi:MAG: ATP-binding cassette domain-containing protein [Sulfolobales archaeon]|mgnify:CR=1 FL=1
MIIIDNVDFSYDKKNYIFKGLKAVFDPYKISVILGPNGVGKTTLLKLIAGVLSPIRGEIRIFGKRPVELRGKIGYIPQLNGLYPWMRVKENIELPLRIRSEDPSKISEIVNKVAEKLSIEELLNKYPKQLSGGEIQKVQLARALISGSDLFLLDEPLSMIDIDYREEIIDLLKKIVSTNKSTIIMVTHNIEDVLELGDKVYIMRNKPAEMIEIQKELVNRDNLQKLYRGLNV